MASPKVHMYVAAFVDLLGQRKALDKIELFPNPGNPQGIDKQKHAMRECVRIVQRMHNMFAQFFAEFSASSPPALMSAEQKRLYGELTSTQIRVQGFSDGLVFFCPLADHAAVASVFGIVVASGGSCLWQLADKHPIRVGVDLHLGAELDECGLYGPVVANAYRLESEVAQYPRVVVGDEVVRYLEVHADQTTNDYKTQVKREMSRCCLGMLEQDIDGHWIVDYLGEGFRRFAAHTPDAKAVTATALAASREFVKQEAETFRTEKNTKLAFRYSLLLDYIESSGRA